MSFVIIWGVKQTVYKQKGEKSAKKTQKAAIVAAFVINTYMMLKKRSA